jgi:hypothetical protein
MGSYGYVPSYQMPKATASRSPEWAMLIRCGKPPGTFDRELRSLPQVDVSGGRADKWWNPVCPPLQPGVVGLSPGTGCMIPHPFAIGGNQSYLEFWDVTSGPWYLGYITPTVAPEPFVERVARAGHSTVGGIGTHMVLWALPWDSTMRLWC